MRNDRKEIVSAWRGTAALSNTNSGLLDHAWGAIADLYRQRWQVELFFK